jgi:hypothetical protein
LGRHHEPTLLAFIKRPKIRQVRRSAVAGKPQRSAEKLGNDDQQHTPIHEDFDAGKVIVPN